MASQETYASFYNSTSETEAKGYEDSTHNVINKFTAGVTEVLPEEKASNMDAPFFFRVIYICLGCLGILGNFMVLVIMVKYKHLRASMTNKFICNQSVLDFLASFFIIVSSVVRKAPVLPEGILQELFCKMWLTNWPMWGLFVSSTYNLVALTFERFFAIVFPLKHNQSFTNCKAVIIMGVIWFFGPFYLGCYGFTSSTIKNGECTVYSEYPNELTQRAVGIQTFVVQYVVPLFSISFAYICIFCTLKKSSKEANKEGINKQHNSRMNKAKKNVIKTLLQVFIGFIFCWSWNQIFYALFNFGYPVNFNSNFYHFTVLCVFSNCCVNPVVYSLNYDQFRSAQKDLFGCGKARANESSTRSRESASMGTEPGESEMGSHCCCIGKRNSRYMVRERPSNKGQLKGQGQYGSKDTIESSSPKEPVQDEYI